MSAFYDIKESKLNISGVPHIRSCDAFIYPENGLVFVKSQGAIDTFNNAKIVADTANQNHVINKVKKLQKQEQKESSVQRITFIWTIKRSLEETSL